MNQPTVWDVFNSRRFRLGALLVLVGLPGLLLMAFLLRVPLGVSILVAVILGFWGVVGSFLEIIVQAVARSRAPFTFRPRAPYEFLGYSGGYFNVSHITRVMCLEKDIVGVWAVDKELIVLDGEDARQFLRYMADLATPLIAMGAPGEV